MSFKQYLKDSESGYQEEIKKTLSKLPKSHAALIKDFKYYFQGSNTLKGDNGHVGLIDIEKKKIVIASPWNYGREHTLLHELAHLVYKHFLTPELREEWKKLCKKAKLDKKDQQPPEELFAHAYASHYVKNAISKFDIPEWHSFIKGIPT